MGIGRMEKVGVIINTEGEFKEFLSIVDGLWGDVPEWLRTMWPTVENNCVYTDKAGWDHAHNCSNQITLAQFKERNGIMKYKQGDVLVANDHEVKILGICGKVYFISEEDDFDNADEDNYTEAWLDNYGYTLKTDEPEMVELTLEDVAKLHGSPVDLIRIKEKE